jgi:hypothetical protein
MFAGLGKDQKSWFRGRCETGRERRSVQRVCLPGIGTRFANGKRTDAECYFISTTIRMNWRVKEALGMVLR